MWWWWIGCADSTTEEDTATAPAELVCVAAEPLSAPQPVACDAVPAPRCGGDPTGTWVAASRCEAGGPVGTVATVSDYACAGDTFVTTASFDETVELGADGTFAWTTSTADAETWTVPSSCLTELGSADCAALAEAYGFPCAEAVDACVCTVTARDTRVFFGGRWEVCDGSLVFVTLDGTATSTASGEVHTEPVGSNQSQVWDFCADGDTLRLFSWHGTVTTGYTRAP